MNNYYTNTLQLSKIEKAKIDGEKIVTFLFSILIFLSFFETYLSGLLGTFTRYFIFIFLLVAIIVIPKVRIRWYHFAYLFWFLYKIITIFWTPNLFLFRLHIVSHVGMTALLLISTSIPFRKKSIYIFIFMLWLSSFMTGVLFLFFKRPYEGIYISRQVIYLFGREMDPNNLAAFLLIGILISLDLIFKKKYIVFSVALIILNFYGILLTGSRGAIVALVISTIVILFLNRKQKSINLHKIIVYLAVASILLVLMKDFVPESIYRRIFDFKSYEDGSGRVEIWTNALSIFKQYSILFGAGWGANYGYNALEIVAHNTFIAMLVDVGLIGFIIFFAPVIYASLVSTRNKNSIPIVLLINSFVLGMFLDTINKRFFWLPIIIVFISYNSIVSDDKCETIVEEEVSTNE